MLVLTRKIEERIQIGNDITITILKVKGNAVRVGIEAPSHVRVMRSELNEKIAAALAGEMASEVGEESSSPAPASVAAATREIAPPLAPAMSSLRELLARRQSMPQAKKHAKV